MDIMDRKLKILNAIINDFIDTAQPIGSRTIAKKYDLGISSATIRNEMADLEEMGYLLQPYTSAGRIPSDLGYRVYINKLMKLYMCEPGKQLKSDLRGIETDLQDSPRLRLLLLLKSDLRGIETK